MKKGKTINEAKLHKKNAVKCIVVSVQFKLRDESEVNMTLYLTTMLGFACPARHCCEVPDHAADTRIQIHSAKHSSLSTLPQSHTHFILLFIMCQMQTVSNKKNGQTDLTQQTQTLNLSNTVRGRIFICKSL